MLHAQRSPSGVQNPYAVLVNTQKQVALVSGAGSADGIGFAIARRLSTDGFRVFLTSTTDRCIERARELADDAHEARAAVADLTDAADVERLVAQVLREYGCVDVLVNNAGMTSVSDPMPAPAPTALTMPEQWMHIVHRNLVPTYLLTRAVLPQMEERRRGRIVNIASTTGTTGAMFGESAYATAKAGIAGFTKTVALEYANVGITVNAVAPGWIATGSQTDDERRQGHATPMRRSGTPDEVAHIVSMLCGASASYITGQCITVDGGNSIAEERA